MLAHRYAREMDLMGVLEPPVENTTCTASVRRQGVTYLVARMVPAALSVMIGWLYVDAFVFKGANLIVKRADLLPTRGFGPPYVLLRVYGLILAAPYWANAYLLFRAAGFFGEKARQQRHEKTRVAMLYERYFGYDGTLFVWKIFAFQIFEVALQSYGKIPLFLIWSSPSVRKSTRASGRPGCIIYSSGSLDAERECLASSHEASIHPNV